MDGRFEFFENYYDLEHNPETMFTLLYFMAKEIESLRHELNELRSDTDFEEE